MASAFKMPTAITITGRTSTITNAFVAAIVPRITPSDAEVADALHVLGQDLSTLSCAYCGGGYTEWDHLRPLVKNRRPTGYVSELRNLVPSCGKCNQSKGNKPWREWMRGNSRVKVADGVEERRSRLERYEKWGNVRPIDLESWVSKTEWQSHWDNLKRVCDALEESHRQANTIRDGLAEVFKKSVLKAETGPPRNSIGERRPPSS